MSSSSKVSTRNSDDVYSAFRKLGPSRRRDIALRILRDERVLADLYDHLLIKRAMDEPGAAVPWKEYQRHTR